jgi:RNase P subunit RPR2
MPVGIRGDEVAVPPDDLACSGCGAVLIPGLKRLMAEVPTPLFECVRVTCPHCGDETTHS